MLHIFASAISGIGLAALKNYNSEAVVKYPDNSSGDDNCCLFRFQNFLFQIGKEHDNHTAQM